MIISAKIIKNPRKIRRCAGCGKKINGTTMRLYGAAEHGDPPYTVYFHLECCDYRHRKVLDALKGINNVS